VTLSRRGLLGGLGLTLAAPAIIRTPGLLMPVRTVRSAIDGVPLPDRYQGRPWGVIRVDGTTIMIRDGVLSLEYAVR
jgi:hypothetical protein